MCVRVRACRLTQCDAFGSNLLLTGGRRTVSSTISANKLVLTQVNSADVLVAYGDALLPQPTIVSVAGVPVNPQYQTMRNISLTSRFPPRDAHSVGTTTDGRDSDSVTHASCR